MILIALSLAIIACLLTINTHPGGTYWSRIALVLVVSFVPFALVGHFYAWIPALAFWVLLGGVSYLFRLLQRIGYAIFGGYPIDTKEALSLVVLYPVMAIIIGPWTYLAMMPL
jgi:hypothetical protein